MKIKLKGYSAFTKWENKSSLFRKSIDVQSYDCYKTALRMKL